MADVADTEDAAEVVGAGAVAVGTSVEYAGTEIFPDEQNRLWPLLMRPLPVTNSCACSKREKGDHEYAVGNSWSALNRPLVGPFNRCRRRCRRLWRCGWCRRRSRGRLGSGRRHVVCARRNKCGFAHLDAQQYRVVVGCAGCHIHACPDHAAQQYVAEGETLGGGLGGEHAGFVAVFFAADDNIVIAPMHGDRTRRRDVPDAPVVGEFATGGSDCDALLVCVD
jgi:hypothetical protein